VQMGTEIMLQWQWRAVVAITCIWVSVFPQAARAQDAARIDRGRVFVEKNCAECHSVMPTGPSRHRSAPPFRVLGEKYPIEHLAEALAEGIIVGHSAMPVFRLEPDEIADLLDYIASLQKPSADK